MKNIIDLTELDDFLRLIEAQREMAYHLQKYKEAQELKLKELELITQKAQKVNALKQKFKRVTNWKRLTEEEIKQINCLLQARHIRI